MRIAIFPIEKEKYRKDNKFSISTEIAYIVSYLEENNPDDIVYPASDLDFLYKTDPDIVCIYAPYSFTYDYIVSISQNIKEKYNIPVILAGDHITALPKTLPISCNVGILGDPEFILKDLVELKRNDSFNEKSFSKIPGVVFNFKNQKVITDKPQYIKDINSLPMTRAVFQDLPGEWLPSIIMGRGKPNNNAWQPLTNQPVRLFSIERIIQDIGDLLANNQGLKTADIKDYLFLYDKYFFKKFIQMYKETQLIKYMKFNVKALISQLDEEIIHDLKDIMQIPKLTIHFISPLEKFYKDLKEEFIPYKKQKDILDICYKYNINIEAKFLYNLPNETIEDSTKTYWKISRNYYDKYKNINIKVSPLVLMPGSELWQKSIFRKIITENFNNWSSLNSFDENSPKINNLSFEEINQIKTYINNKFDNKTEYFEVVYNYENELLSKANSQLNSVKELLNNNNISEFDMPVISTLSVYQEVSDIISTFENTLVSSNSTISQVIDSINLSKDTYTNIKNNFLRNDLMYSNNINYLSLEYILSEISQNANLKTVLQIANKNLIDIKNMFKNDYLEVDYIDPDILNKPIINLQTDKLYDLIVLYFNLDSIINPDKLIKLCANRLNENGALAIAFYNPKNIVSLIHLMTNQNLNKTFYNYKRTNYFTLEKLDELLKNNGFISKQIDSVIFPGFKFMSFTEKTFKEPLLKFIRHEDLEKLIYIYICRKNTEI